MRNIGNNMQPSQSNTWQILTKLDTTTTNNNNKKKTTKT